MLTDEDRAQIASVISEVIADRAASITIRRGDSTLAAQSVRIERRGKGGAHMVASAEGGTETRAMAVVVGATTLDIQIGDRFTYGGTLYRVFSVKPNKEFAIQAEVEVIE